MQDLEYYHQTPPKVPHFIKTLFRRKLVLWFLASEVLRDYWLSGVCQRLYPTCPPYLMFHFQPYGRNWSFLWSATIPKWQILLLIITFFIGVWAAMLLVLTHFSKTHTWLLPVFAVGLGAPRWCQVRHFLFLLYRFLDFLLCRCCGEPHLWHYMSLGRARPGLT